MLVIQIIKGIIITQLLRYVFLQQIPRFGHDWVRSVRVSRPILANNELIVLCFLELLG